MLDVKVFKNIDTKKIQEYLEKNQGAVLVGFLSGRQHVETLHKDKDGNYKKDFGDPATKEPIDVAELARQLSYGTATIPARPFLTEGIDSKKTEIETAFRTELEKSKATGQKPNLNKIGTMAVGAIQDFVRSDHYKRTIPNSKKTIEYKESDTPLIDGGDLINSLTYKIEGAQ